MCDFNKVYFRIRLGMQKYPHLRRGQKAVVEGNKAVLIDG